MKCKPTAKDWADLLTLTLYLAGGRIRGKTRLQKLAFIVWQRIKRYADELPPELSRLACLEFKPANYGPYSPELYTLGAGYAEKKNMIMLEKPLRKPEVYSITDRGESRARTVYMMMTARGLQLNGEIKELARLPLSELVRLVYDAYPEYTIKSKIKEKLESGAVVAWDRLEEGDIDLVNDLIREGVIKMHGPIFLDMGQEFNYSLLGNRVQVSVQYRDIHPKIFVSIYPLTPREDNSKK